MSISKGMAFPWPTIGKYDYYEVLSALQKSIRRGLEEDALFWATELYLSDYESHAWNRFLVIASEDIGVADSSACAQIRALYDTWKERKKESDARLYFVHALLILVRAPKSRIVDHALITFFEGLRPHVEIPDYALDMHTRVGKSMGRGAEHFFSVGATLKNQILEDNYVDRARIIRGSR